LLVDALDQYDFCFDMIAANDVYAPTEFLHSFETKITNTSKHIVAPAQTTDRCELLVEMGIAVSGSLEALQERPIFQVGGCPISPLSYPRDMAETIIYFAKKRLPLHSLSMSMAGGMAPTTLAGTLAVHNAEVLAGLVLSQTVQPGAPYIYGSSTSIMWLKNASALLGCPELGVINAGLAKLTQMYNLPSFLAGT
jgi:trimethylamine---corrinoid protein Co-methyltransferase